MKKNKQLPPNGFLKKNTCPYCGYNVSATMCKDDEKAVPQPRDLTFCMMCTELCKFDEKMKLIKFDINSIQNLVDRSSIKLEQLKIRQFWEENPDARQQEFYNRVNG